MELLNIIGTILVLIGTFLAIKNQLSHLVAEEYYYGNPNYLHIILGYLLGINNKDDAINYFHVDGYKKTKKLLPIIGFFLIVTGTILIIISLI